MTQVVGDVKCYHCGHISGQVQGTRADAKGGRKLVLHSFQPRPGYSGERPGAGDRLRCERCQGPVYLEDLRPAPVEPPVLLPSRTKRRPAKSRAA